MKYTIVYDNETLREDLTPAWGFACFIEAEKNILFDTGWDGNILLSNMKKLGYMPSDIDVVVLSHQHWDHIGGLPTVLSGLKDIEVVVPKSFSKNLVKDMSRKNSVRVVDEPKGLFDGVYSTGNLVCDFKGMSLGEQSIAFRTSKGLVVVTGCSHPGVEQILESASSFGKVCGLIGGLHGFDKLGVLEGLEFIVPTHCTQHKKKILERFVGNAEECGVGWEKTI